MTVDALWGFTIGTAADIREHVAHHVQGRGIAGGAILHCLLMMGTYDWTANDIFQQGNFPLMAFRYTSVLGNCLLQRIKRTEELVRHLRSLI